MDSETALTTPTTAFVTDWTRLACRLSPAIQSIRRPARLTVITFRFMSDHDDLYLLELQALNEGISQPIVLHIGSGGVRGFLKETVPDLRDGIAVCFCARDAFPTLVEWPNHAAERSGSRLGPSNK